MRHLKGSIFEQEEAAEVCDCSVSVGCLVGKVERGRTSLFTTVFCTSFMLVPLVVLVLPVAVGTASCSDISAIEMMD
jgi:hypothetical protein